MTTFPYGYYGNPQGMGTQLTLAQVLAKQTVVRLHPEFRRRMIALMTAAAEAGVPLGVGTGWRVQPSKPNGDPLPGFARPGNSNHEGFPVGPGSTGAVAADMVPNISWPWMHANVARFGLRTFKYVNNEPWHIQPIEIPASRNWRTQPWDLATFALPGDAPAPVPSPAPAPVPPPAPPAPQPEFPLVNYIPLEDDVPLYFRVGTAFYAVKDSGGWRPASGPEVFKLARRGLDNVQELTPAEIEALRQANPNG